MVGVEHRNIDDSESEKQKPSIQDVFGSSQTVPYGEFGTGIIFK